MAKAPARLGLKPQAGLFRSKERFSPLSPARRALQASLGFQPQACGEGMPRAAVISEQGLRFPPLPSGEGSQGGEDSRARTRLLLCILLSLLALAPLFAQTTAQSADPLLWPEPQRAFLQDGPALLLSEEQRASLLRLDEAGREAFIRDFIAENRLREGIERRLRLASRDFVSPRDARAQLLFLKGEPAAKRVLDCGNTFRPLEIWTYGLPPYDRSFVLYQRSPDEPFRLWLPIDSKAALYTPDMENWLDQWQQLGMGGSRIDRRFCPDSAQVDLATGLDGLSGEPARGGRRGTERRPQEPPEGGQGSFRWIDPRDRVWLLERPRDLAAWAREAAATPLPAEPPRLAVESFDMDFPYRQGQRLVARALLSVSPGESGFAVVKEGDKSYVRLAIDGTLEYDDRTFDRFRMRFRFPPPTEPGPVPLLLERPLRPGQPFLLRLRVHDEGSAAQALLARGFHVPEAPQPRLAAVVDKALSGEAAPLKIAGRDSLLLLPPLSELVIGVWRADAMVTGDRIAKVVFLVDGEAQLSRTRPPYSAEVRLSPFPREQVVRAEGYDAAGELVAADQMVLNQARGAFRVAITEPKPSRRATGRVRAQAEVVVPEERKVERVEFRVNDAPVASRTEPPWQADIEIPRNEEIVYLTVVAQLDDGARAEDVRFLRAPENLEQVDVNLVELYTTVTDSTGHPVRGLEAKDFEILEEGKPQAIAKFERVENLPLTLGLVIDTSTSMASSLVEAQRAASGFLENVMTPRDRGFAVGFSRFPYLLMPPVDDVEGLSQALEGLRASGSTSLHDAIITGLYYFRSTKGQRALILLTDGDDTSSSAPWENALEYASRSGVAVYSIGLAISTLDLDARRKLSNLAEATGGRVFFIDKAEELSGVYEQIEQELRSRYLLAFNTNRKADDLGFRPVEVKVRRGLRARTLRGYYP